MPHDFPRRPVRRPGRRSGLRRPGPVPLAALALSALTTGVLTAGVLTAGVLTTGVLTAGPAPAAVRSQEQPPDTAAPTGEAGGTGRTAMAGGTTGTTLPAAPVRVRLRQVASAEQPLAVVPRAGDDALYVVEKLGRIRALRNGVFDATPVLDIRPKVSSENERGLLGLAFPPSGAPVLYVDYTDKAGRVTVSELPFDGTTADASKERVLLSVAKPYNEHNAGTIFFDAKGLLYVTIGDGGSFGDPQNNAQRLNTLLGKVLRIDPTPSGGKPYTIPAGNPFAKRAGARPEILAYGLRNPWRTTLDAVTGELWIPDVGQNMWEEVNRLPAGRTGVNFGWRWREGTHAYKGPKPKDAVNPVYDYPHLDGRCAVAGGSVYRGAAIPALTGWYVFGDVCSGQLSVLRPNADRSRWTPLSLGARVAYLTAFGTDGAGELYATSLEGGVYKLVP